MVQVNGFSKLSKLEKINFLIENYLNGTKSEKRMIQSFWHPDEQAQKIFDEFSENTISNYYIPYGVVPNVLLNGKTICVPMAIEESSVVAACSKAAKFWLSRGGFKAKVISTTKIGQIHFMWNGEFSRIRELFLRHKEDLIAHISPITLNMEKRGGGVREIELVNMTDREEHYYQIKMSFNTCNAMGANFINSVLEAVAQKWCEFVRDGNWARPEDDIQIIMAILSNYTPDCLVRTWVECPVTDLQDPSHEMSAEDFANKMKRAVRIAEIDTFRAATHNKGIFNGIDAVVLATANDFRAVEACGHAYAARDGQYRGLTHCEITDNVFTFWIDIPLSLGTVGGLTSLHPLAKLSLEMLNNPSAEELMMITASVGLAQNFAALRSLVTTGIQKGHMKMHLMNILNHLEATAQEREIVSEKMQDQIITFNGVREILASQRNLH